MKAGEFLEFLFGDTVGTAGEVVLFRSDTRRAAWFNTTSAAGSAAERDSAFSNVYFTSSLQDRAAAAVEAERRDRLEHERDQAKRRDEGLPEVPFSPRAFDFVRGFSMTATCVPGLQADVDIAGTHHKKAGLAPSIDAIRRKLGMLPAQPTVVLATGGGVQLWWIFREPLVFDTADERDKFERVAAGWQRFIQREIGYVVDPTHELARLMRMPGLRNHKHGVDTSVLDTFKTRYNPSDFDTWQAPPLARETMSDPASFDGIVINGDAHPPLNKILQLASLDSKFGATWARKRKDLPSQSEYDMSLAMFAARNGFTDQEIVDTCVAHRREGGELKDDWLRPNYWRLLLAKVRTDPKRERARENIEAKAVEIDAGRVTQEDARPALIEDLSKALGIPIVRIVKFLGDPPTYRLDLIDKSISIPDVDTILDPKHFRAIVAAASNRLIGRYKGHEWDPIAQSILHACTDEDLGPDSSPPVLAIEWLSSFLADHKPAPAEERDKALASRKPWLEEGHLMFWLAEVVAWVKVRGADRVSRNALARALRAAGATTRVVGARKRDGSPTTVNVWQLAQDRLPVAAGAPFAPTAEMATSTALDGQAPGDGPAGGDVPF